MLILGGGGEGVRVRSGEVDCPGPMARSKEGLRASSLDIVGMLPSPLFPALTGFDPVVLSSGAVPDGLGVYCNKNGEPRAEVLTDCYRIAKCEMKESEMNGIGE